MIKPGTLSVGQKVSIDVDVVNTGKLAGSEVARLYVGLPSSEVVPQPPRQLRGFQKLHLKPGQKGHVHWDLDARALSYWNLTDHGWAVAPGRSTFLIGSSSRDIKLRGEVRIGASSSAGN